MGAKTGIEWTDATWNPIRGCSRVSEGCRHCYAEGMAARFSGSGMAYDGLAVMQHGKPHWTGSIKFVEEHLLDPLKWKMVSARDPLDPTSAGDFRSRRIFVNSMSDLFHENVTDEMRDKIFAVMALCPQHTFQVLTKRPERMLEYLAKERRWFHIQLMTERLVAGTKWKADYSAHRNPDFLDHIHLGVSVENQKAADERIPLLLETPAAVRFISAEPLLGEVDLTVLPRIASDFDRSMAGFDRCSAFYIDALAGSNGILMKEGVCHEEPVGFRPGIDWVICGGESGPGARPMDAAWARSLRDQCAAANVPFFFKQWGEYLPSMQDGANLDDSQELNCSDRPIRVGKHKAGALLDGVEYKQFPAVSA